MSRSAERDQKLSRSQQNAFRLLLLFLWQFHTEDRPSWIHRRVESMAMLDDVTIQRRISIDFSLPAKVGSATVPALEEIPLTWLPRAKLRGLDVRDENGSAVPVLTRAQSRELILRAVLAWLGSRDTPEADAVAANLRMAVLGARNDRKLAVEALAKSDWGQDAGKSLMKFLTMLVDHVVLIARMHAAPGNRHLVKIHYCEHVVVENRTRVSRIAQRLGLAPKSVTVRAAPADQAESFHFEFDTPGELRVLSTELRRNGVPIKRDLGSPGQLWYCAVREVSQPLTDKARELENEHGLWLRMLLRVDPHGFLTFVVWLTAVSALLLFAVFLSLDSVVRQPDVGTAFLIALPGLLVGAVLRPGEHAVASRLLAGVRLMVAVTIMCSIGAACLLVLDIAPTWRASLWFALYVLALVAFSAVFAAFMASFQEDEPLVAKPSRRQRGLARRLRRALGALAVYCCVALLVFVGVVRLIGEGPADYIHNRLADAAGNDRRANLVRASELTRFRWTRLYVLGPRTSRTSAKMIVGNNRLDVATDEQFADRWPPIGDASARLVFVDGGAVVKQLDYPERRGDFRCLAARDPDGYVRPQQHLRVTAGGEPETLRVLTRKDDATTLSLCELARA